MAAHDYLLDNRSSQAAERFDALSVLFDPVSLRQSDACGLTDGWRCWEAGAGAPALVHMMAQQVGDTGHMLATDIDDSWTKAAASNNISVLRHDVAHDAPPDDRFDLIHARLVLVHLPERERALGNMVSALKPGGWLVVEDAAPALQPLRCSDEYG